MRIDLEIKICNYQWERAACGAEAVFVPYVLHVGGDMWGVKLYGRLGEAESARNKQRTFANEGLAPPIGDVVRAKVLRGYKDYRKPMTKFGYLTGQCRTLPVADRWQMDWLERRIAKAGLKIEDLKTENVGWWRDSLVCIDFGEVSNARRTEQ